METFSRHIEIRQIGDCVVVYFTRSRILHTTEHEQLAEKLREVVEVYRPRSLVLNLHNVVFLPSAVLSHLVTLKVRLGKQGRRFALCNLRPEIAEILRIAGLDRWFTIFADEQDALAALSTTAGESLG